jgi:hypothetical protein
MALRAAFRAGCVPPLMALRAAFHGGCVPPLMALRATSHEGCAASLMTFGPPLTKDVPFPKSVRSAAPTPRVSER